MAQHHTEYGVSPVGRIISGDPWTKQTTDANNRPIPDDKQRYWFALAVEKSAPGANEMLATLHKAAAAGYQHVPNVMAQINQGLAAPAFSWKADDGDEMRPNPTTGVPELRWKHGQGCWIFKFSTTLPIRAAKYQGNVPTDCDRSEIKRGYYVQVAYSTSANGNTDHTAGVYLNPQSVCLVAFGQEIVSGPSLEQQFGQGPGGYLPQGASQTPLAPTGAPGAAPAGMPQAQPAAQPPAHGQPMGNASGMPTPADNGPAMATGYHGDTAPPTAGMPGAQPAAAPYGGYMHPGQPPAGMPAPSAPPYGGYMQPPAGMPGT